MPEGILFLVSSEISTTEEYLINLIKTSGKEKKEPAYELIKYINDVNREYTEVLAEQNINGTLDTAYVYGAAVGMGSDRLSLNRFDSSTGYYLYDPRGSVTGITDEEGQVYRSYRYSAFGEITFGASEYENEYTYNGESYNPNIRSQYLRARYYSVVTADFLTEDSYLGNIMEPLTLNRYNYCVGNPVNHADPSGNISVVRVGAPAGLQLIYDAEQMMQDQEFPVENWGTGLESLRSSGLGVLSALESAVYNMVEPMWVSKENLKNIFTGHHRTLPDIILEYEQMADAEVRRLAAKAEDKTAFYNARCHSDAWIAAASATAAEKGASGVGAAAMPGTVVYVAGSALVMAGGVVLTAGSVKTLAQDQHRLLQAEEEARQEAGDKIEPNEESKPVKPESAVTGSKKHGVNWKEGPARAKATGNPQGQWAQSDLDYATEMANTLNPGESGYFDLPEGSQSIVHIPDGTTQPATRMWIRNNGAGTWHGYPMQ